MSSLRTSFVLACLLTASAALAAEFVPIRSYFNVGDSPFPDFGLGEALIIENLDAGVVTQPGLTISSASTNLIREGYSVQSQEIGQVGQAIEAFPTSCAATYPPQCPAKVTLEFSADAFGQMPTYVGFVWTDAVRASENANHPWARVNVTDIKGVISENLINELPIESRLESQFADDTLIGFVSDAGIQRLDITVVTDGSGLGGHLAIDHIQYGMAALSGDTDRDGDVDFADFTVLLTEFGNQEASWSEADFNFNNQTEFTDFLAMALNYGEAREMPTRIGAPEASSACLAWLGLIALLGLRKRFK